MSYQSRGSASGTGERSGTMTDFVMRARSLAPLGRWLLRRTQTRWSLLDQGLVSGLGFLTGVAAARLLGLEQFGVFAIVMILAALAQGVHNAFVVTPLMSLAGTPRGGSSAFYGSALGLTLAMSIPVAVSIGFLMAGLNWTAGKPLSLSLVMAAGTFGVAQNLLLTVRRILFAKGRGGEGLVADAARGAGLVLVLGMLFALRTPVRVDVLIWLLALVGVIPSVFAMGSLWPVARGRQRPVALARRCWPMARWLLPSVLATFAQEQFVWLVVGVSLGDAPVGGLRAAQYLVSLAYPFMAALENVVPVEAGRVYLAGGLDALQRYIARTVVLFSPLALGVPVLAACSAHFWLRTFFGPSFEAFAGCLQVFALVVLFVFVRDMLGYFFRATGRTKLMFQAFVASSIATLVVIVPLLHGLGVLGAAIGIATGQGLSMAFLILAALRLRHASRPC